MKLLVFTIALVGLALAEPPLFQSRFVLEQQKEADAENVPGSAPYPPSGTRPKIIFELPVDQVKYEPQREYLPSQQQAAPQQAYGAPDQQYGAPQQNQQSQNFRTSKAFSKPAGANQAQFNNNQQNAQNGKYQQGFNSQAQSGRYQQGLNNQAQSGKYQQEYNNQDQFGNQFQQNEFAEESYDQYKQDDQQDDLDQYQQSGKLQARFNQKNSNPDAEEFAPQTGSASAGLDQRQQVSGRLRQGANQPAANQGSQSGRYSSNSQYTSQYRSQKQQQQPQPNESERKYNENIPADEEKPDEPNYFSKKYNSTNKDDKESKSGKLQQDTDDVELVPGAGGQQQPVAQGNSQSGFYYLLLPNGQLQKVAYMTQQDLAKMVYSARLQYENVNPIQGPVYTYNPNSSPLTQVFK